MAQPSSDRLAATDAAEALNFLILETGEKTSNPDMLNSQDAIPIGPRRDIVDQSVSLGSVGCHKSGYIANVYSSQAPSVYIGSYDNADGKQNMYVPFVNNEALDNGSHGICSEPSSVAFHYECSPQMVHKSCVPVTSQYFARDNGHLYNATQFPTSDSFCFQQSINSLNSISPTPVSQEKFPLHIDLQRNSKRSSLRANYSSPLRSSGRGGSYFGNSGGLDLFHQGVEGSDVGGLLSDLSNLSDGSNYLLQLSSPPTSLKPLGSPDFFQDDFGLASQQKGSLYGFGSSSGSSYTSYSYHQRDLTSDCGGVSISSIEMDGQIWPRVNEVKHRRRCNDFSCSCSVTLDMLSERNRGPRAFKPKIRTMENGSAVENSKNSLIDGILRDSYNQLDFVTKYKDAKFFVIKSYSEDNVHKSIKYGVWASTPNGNKKLDSAYREAKEKHETCPMLLFYSVNASAQFCGVAEMVGPVDFHQNVDYWLQDKWSGQFPVKWHIIKDVPNSQFRHILLENNDNKPVTNSRDTQEVEMEQGIEMLNIFKNYETYSSILDDFYFYEQRQKAMQERKGRLDSKQASPPVVSDQQFPVSLSTDSIEKLSKSFAEAVSLTKHEKERSAVGKVVSSTAASVAYDISEKFSSYKSDT